MKEMGLVLFLGASVEKQKSDVPWLACEAARDLL